LEVIVVVDCMVMVTATMKVKIKGILLLVGNEEILIAINKQVPSINGMETDVATKAASGSGLKSKYCPLEKGSVNIKTIPTATIKNTANPIIRDSFENIEDSDRASLTTLRGLL
jgi:hypothetical protein